MDGGKYIMQNTRKKNGSGQIDIHQFNLIGIIEHSTQQQQNTQDF